MKKIHIGFHKAGSTFLQRKVFPKVPNYKGKLYIDKKYKHLETLHNFTPFYKKGKNPQQHCKTILKYFEKYDNHFISDEIFSKIKHDEFFWLLDNYNYDNVLLFDRNLEDLIKSRKRHKSRNFFLQKKINNNIIDKEIINHYSTEKLNKWITNLTIINFEKFFSGDKKEIKKLSEFLEYDVEDIVLSNLYKKINSR